MFPAEEYGYFGGYTLYPHIWLMLFKDHSKLYSDFRVKVNGRYTELCTLTPEQAQLFEGED